MKRLLVCLLLVGVVGCGDSKEEKAAKTDAAAAQAKPTKGVPITIDDPIVKKAIREELDLARISRSYHKPFTNELTTADLEKIRDLTLADNQLTRIPKELVKLTKLKRLDISYNQLTDVKGLEKLNQLTSLSLEGNKLTDVKGLEKLTNLERLYLEGNPDLTKAQIAELKKALPKCKIYSNPKK